MDKRSFSDQAGPVVRNMSNFVGDELGVVFDPPEQRGPPRVLPGETEEVKAGHVSNAAPVKQRSVLVGNGKLDP
jgi:hypothetical protein